MSKLIKYIPCVILILLFPILIYYQSWQLVVSFVVFSVFSFFFLREFNRDELNATLVQLAHIETNLNEKIDFISAELAKNQEKTKDLNNSLVSIKMSRGILPQKQM